MGARWERKPLLPASTIAAAVLPEAVLAQQVEELPSDGGVSSESSSDASASMRAGGAPPGGFVSHGLWSCVGGLRGGGPWGSQLYNRGVE